MITRRVGGLRGRSATATLLRSPVLAWLLLLLLALPAFAGGRRDRGVTSQFVRAERLREALNGRPAKTRSRREYQRVINAYRSVYFQSPTSGKAAASVVAVAEIMVDMGRRFDDRELLRSAIKQYEFLRSDYPGSRHRLDALFTIGQIYKDDLGDDTRAKEIFQEYLKKYPHSRLAAQARKSIREMTATKRAAKDNDSEHEPAGLSRSEKAHLAKKRSEKSQSSIQKEEDLPRITSIRHWSTPDYTRVALDLEKAIKFDSQRIGSPERIVFNLRDARLASVLVGKSFDVQDGLLRKIRVAEPQPGQTRLVLEVDDLAKYSAFLLPNPDRLIIDVHGQDGSDGPTEANKNTSKNADESDANDEFADDGDEPPVKVSKSAGAAKHAATEAERTRVSEQPGRKVISDLADDSADDDDTAASSADETAVSKTSTSVTAKMSRSGKAARAESASAKASNTAPLRASKTSRGRKESAYQASIREARPSATGDRSLIRALGLKIGKIVIDAGHGGQDTGTIGPRGLLEKDLVLDVSLRLGKLLQDRLGADVVYTRDDDTFVPLETRTAVANKEQADLFVSLHANSSHNPDARGVETYYLNFTSSADALEVAARENAVSAKSIHELQDLIKKIALKEKIGESREFAVDVQRALYSGLAARTSSIRDRGVKKAPFVVLIGANMPSILAEISFVSNPEDERNLESGSYRQKIAESLYHGIARYAGGLSGVKVASTAGKSQGQ